MSDNNELKYKITVDASQATKNIQKFQSNLKKAFDGSGTTAGLNKMRKDMDKTLAGMSKSVAKTGKDIDKGFSKSIQGMSNGLKAEVKRMSKIASTATATGKILGKAVLKGMQMALTGISAIGKVMFKALQGLAGMFTTLGKTFGMAISNGIRLATGILRTTGKFISTAIGTGLRAGYGVIKSAANGLTKVISVSLNGAFQVASNVAGKITGVISKAINQKGKIDLQANMGNYESGAYQQLSGGVFMNSMNNLLSAMKATLPKQIGSVFESVTVGLANSFSKLGNTILLVSQSFTFFKAFGPKILSMITGLMSSIKPYIQSAMNLVGSYMKLQMGTTFAPLRTALGLLVNQCKAAGQALVDMGHNTISSLSSVSQIMTTVWQTLSSAVNIVINSFNLLKNTIGGAAEHLKTAFSNIKLPVEEFLAPFRTNLLAAANTISGPFAEALLSVAAFLDGDFKGGFEHALTSLREGIPAMLKYVQNDLGDVVGLIRDVFAEIPNLIIPVINAMKPWASAFNGLAKLLRPFVPALTELIKLVLKVIEALGVFADKLMKFAAKFMEPIENFANGLTNIIKKLTGWVDSLLGKKTTSTSKPTNKPITKDEPKDLNSRIDKAYKDVQLKRNMRDMKTPYTDEWKKLNVELEKAQNNFFALKKQKELDQSEKRLNEIKQSGNAYSNERYILEDKIKKLKEEIAKLNKEAGIELEVTVDENSTDKILKDIQDKAEKAFTDLDIEDIKLDIDTNDLQKRLDNIKSKSTTNTTPKNDFKITQPSQPKNSSDSAMNKMRAKYEEIVAKAKETVQAQNELTSSVEKTSESVKKTAEAMAEVTVCADAIDVSESTSAFDTLRQKAIQTADTIKNKLNNIETNVSQEEVEELTNDFAKAKKEFQDMFKMKGGSGSLKKDLGGVMEQISKYSTMLAKIKNPLLTVRTEKAKQALKELTDNAKATKAAYDKFKTTSKIDQGIQASGSGFSMLERMESKVIKLKDGFNLLKSTMKTAFSYSGFNKATAELGKSEADLKKSIDLIVKMKDKMKSTFKTMFNAAASSAKSGWAKITSIFKKGTDDCARPVNQLKGIVSKLAGAFGLYQLGSVMREATQSAVKYEAALATVQRTLGGASQKLIDFAEGNAVAFGLSKEQVMSYGNIYSLIVSNFESDTAKVASTTEKLLQAAGTIAAGTGNTVESVLENLRSGINGSSEAVDQLGLNLKVANMAAKAGVKDWNKLTTEQQQAIIVQEILNQTAAKYGGIVDTAASRQAMFTAQLANTKMALGNLGATIWSALLPALTTVLKYLEVVFNYATKVVSALMKMFGMNVSFGGGSATNNVPATKPQQTVKPQVDSSSTEDATNKNDKLSDSYGKVGDSAKKSAKDVKDSAKTMKGSLAGIDEINVLSFDKGDSGEDDPADNFTMPDYDDVEFELPQSFVDGISGIDDIIIEEIEPAFGKIEEFFKKLFEPLQKAWENMSPRLLKAIQEFTTAAKDAFKALGDLLDSIWDNGGKELVQHLAEIALAMATVAIEIETRLLKAFKRLCEYLDPTVNKVTKATIDALNEAAEATRDFILGITEHFNSLMDNGLEQFILNFADTFNKGITTCAKVWEEFMYAMDELLDHLDPIANEFSQKLLDDMNSAIIAVGDSFLAFADLVKQFRENGGQELVNAIGDIIVAILDLGAKLTEVGANALSGLFEHLDPSQNEIAKNCIDSFTQFGEQIRNALGTIGDAIERFMTQSGGQELVNNLADIIMLIADFAATLTGDIIDTIASFFDSWAGHMVLDLAAAALTVITDALKGLLEILNGPLAPLIEGLIVGFGALSVVQKVATFFGPLVTLFQTLAAPGGLMAVLTGLVGKLAAAFPMLANPVGLTIAAIAALAVGFVALYNKCEPFRELVDRIIEGFKGFVDAVEKHMLPIIERVKNIFGNVIDIIVGIFEGDGEKVGEAVRNLITNIISLFGELTLAFFDIGVNLIEGLVKGIWECVKAIPKLLAGVGKFIIDFFKGLFGIHSPSKEFATLGGYMIDGLVEGLSDISSVIKELGNMAKNIITEANTKLKETGKKCVTAIKDGISKAAKTLKDKGKDIIDGIQQGCKNNWDKLKDTGKTLGSKIKEGFCKFLGINSPSRVMKEQGKHIVDGVKQGIEGRKSVVTTSGRNLGKSIDTSTVQGMSKISANVSNVISKMATATSNAAKKVVSGIVKAFDGVSSKITKKFDTVKTSIGNIFDKVKDTVIKVVDSIKDAFKFEWKLPKLKLPKVSVSWTNDNIFGIKMPKFDIKWNRSGGLINSPSILGTQLAGGGEAGKEVVVPLENSTFAKTFADTVGNMMLDIMKEQTAAMIKSNNSSSQSNSNSKQDVVLKINEREFGRASIDAINKYQKQVGKTLLRV